MPLLTYASIGVGVLTAVLLFRFFFRDYADFNECFPNCFWFWEFPNLENRWAQLKLIVWAGISTGAGFAAHYKLPIWIPQILG